MWWWQWLLAAVPCQYGFFVFYSCGKNACRELKYAYDTTLPSVGKKAHVIQLFVMKSFVVRTLPRVTLGKPFTESKSAFPECIGHLANRGFP